MSSNSNATPSKGNSPLDQLAPSLISLIRLSTAVNSKDIGFFNSIDSAIKDQSESINRKIVKILEDLVHSTLSIIPDQDLDENKLIPENESDNWKIVSNVLDSLFENVEISLDQYSKFKKSGGKVLSHNSTEITNEYTYLDDNDASSTGNINQRRPLPQSTNIDKPQELFKTSVDNFESTPFKPLITTKPNALKSFAESMSLVPATDDTPEHYDNPYSYEIMNQDYPEWILSPSDEQYESIPWKESPEPIWIDSPSQLDELLVDLQKCKVIGIDLEHHDFRTYHGLTSLMQITTDWSKHDYLIDPLSAELRPHLTSLNVVFTDPSIVKVFHGSYMDIIWLQRDLGLYVVSLFDTFHASRELSLGKHSLAFLLENYVKFKTSKKWQLADWRIRPLNEEMRDYAKADTHFLIEIFHKMHNELLKDSEKLKKVLYESRKVSNRRFEYSTYRPKNLKMASSSFSSQQADVVSTIQSVPQTSEFKENFLTFNYDRDLPWTNMVLSNGIPPAKRPLLEVLFKWRDTKAREQDESVRFVMSDFMLVALVNAFELDTPVITEGNVLEVVTSSARFGGSSYVRKCIKELTTLIRDALIKLREMDTEIWNKASGITAETEGTKIQETENIYESVEDVDMLEKNFELLAKTFQAANFHPVSTETSKLIEPETRNPIATEKNDSVWSVEYPKKGGVTYVSLNTVKERLSAMVDYFKKDDQLIVNIDGNAEEEEEKPSTESIQESSVESTPQSVKENPNDIISLRKHQKHNQRRPAKDTTFQQDEIKLDLKGKKILEEPEREDKRRPAKKRKTFDPYVQVDDLPKLKKKKPVDMSKNVVYKKRK